MYSPRTPETQASPSRGLCPDECTTEGDRQTLNGRRREHSRKLQTATARGDWIHSKCAESAEGHGQSGKAPVRR